MVSLLVLRRATAALAVSASMLGITSAGAIGASAQRSATAGTDRSVLVVGDSLTVDATEEIRSLFAARGHVRVEVVAYGGTPIGWAAEQARRRHADIVVMASGTNNGANGWGPEDVAQTKAGIDVLASRGCGVWVLPATYGHPAGGPSSRNGAAAATVAGIRALTSAAGVPAASWAKIADTARDLHTWDGVHHNARGQVAYARFIVDTVDRHCNPAPYRGDLAEHERFVDAAFRTFLGRDPHPEERSTWARRLVDGQQPVVMARMLATSTEWINIQVTHLYRSALDRSPDDGGLVDWRNVILSGSRLSDVGAAFYGSPEFHLRSGATNRGFVAALYRQILGREPDAPGLDDWVRRLDGELDRRTVAASFYASVESRRQRVTDLYRRVLGRDPDPSGLGHWSGRLLRIDDVALAEHLVSSYEFFLRSRAA